MSKGGVLIFQRTSLSPYPGHWGHLHGWDGERPGVQHPGLEFLKEPTDLGPTDHVEIPPGSPKPLQTPCLWFCSPLGLSSHPHPLPRSSSLCKSPRWHLDLCRWPVVHLEANLSQWDCEKAHECEHLALPQGSSQETVSTETVFAVLVEAYELQNSVLGGIE